ncbi:MAG TPA: hypothetical protein VFI14_05730 [Chryseosolibacter sp.]|jgi:hypothetical protein|nr:hypothetical protein [Chryseosolibacter sp.]
MKKKGLHVLTIIMGAIVALAIVFSQYLTPDRFAAVEKVKTEKSSKDKADDHSGSISLPTFSLPSPVDVQANLSSYCLFEILFEQDSDEDQVQENILHAEHFFETLFRVIISPNAP